MERVDIKIGFGCNNYCLFCVQGKKRDFRANKDIKEIEKSLKESFAEGKREVVFTGGEPCMHPDILKVISLARDIGFKQIQIQTNGRMFAYKDFCRRAVDAGATEFSPSLHGHTAEIHDFLTGAKGSFKQTLRGIENLKDLGQYVLTNSVITSKNYRYLVKMAKVFTKLGVNQFQFAFIHLGGTAWENREWITPKKSEIMPFVKKALDIGIKAGKIVSTEAIPYCLMGGYENCIAENFIPETSIYDAGFAVKDYSKYRVSKGKTKGPNCKKCKYFKVCEGPWKEYPELYGWSEFVPVKK